MAKRQPVQIDTTVGDAINTMYSGIGELGDELRSWYDNMPENMQSGSKGEEVDEAATTLEDTQQNEPDVPASIRDFPLMFQSLPLLRRATRSDRLDDFISYGRKAIEVIEARIEGLEAKEDRTEDEQEELDDMQQLRDDVQEGIDGAEGVSFPGAY